MNRNILKHILILLLFSTAVLSCSAVLIDSDIMESPSKYAYSEYNLVISGSVSDMDTSNPIQEIRITLQAKDVSDKTKTTTYEKSVYTDNEGIFSLKAEGFVTAVSIILKAEDPNGKYKPAQHEIPLISWDSHYNMDGNVFYINDCSFHLEKKK